MKKIPSKQYTEEFKREAVRLVLEQGLSASEVGRRLDVPNQSISNWVRLSRKPSGEDAAPGSSISELQAELAKVRAENARLKLDKEILKKAAAYFAKELS
jgi:transposase